MIDAERQLWRRWYSWHVDPDGRQRAAVRRMAIAGRAAADAMRAYGLALARAGEAAARLGAAIERTAPPASAAPGSRGRGPGG